MKIFISILNYVDTIDVLIDGLKIDINKLSFFSKAEFECDVEMGVHEITVVKKSEILGRNWKKSVLFDWISCLFGVPDWTLSEKALDTQKSSVILKVNVEQDVHINLKLTEDGFELTEIVKDILDIAKQTETNKTAKKRIKNAYMIPAIILATVIEICLLTVVARYIVYSQYTISIIVFALAVFWAGLVCGMLFKRKKR